MGGIMQPERGQMEPTTLEELKELISSNLQSMARNFCAVGYYLKYIRDTGMYRDGGYNSIWELAAEEFGISKSTASRYMTMNDRYSVGGNSPELDVQYQLYDKSKLQEMLYLSDSQLEQVEPGMSVQQIRELRRPREIPYVEIPGQLNISDFIDAPLTGEEEPGELFPGEAWNGRVQAGKDILGVKELVDDPDTVECGDLPGVATSQQLSAYGTPAREYPPDSLIAEKGCEGGHDCFLCAMDCRIRMEERYCREAPMGNPFSCEIASGDFRNLGDWCQFVNHDLAYHRAGDHEPDPCCKKCGDPCEYICSRAMQYLDQQREQDDDIGEDNVIDVYDPDVREEDGSAPGRYDKVCRMLEKESDMLRQMDAAFGDDEKAPPIYEKQQIMVAALEALAQSMEHEEEPQEEPEPEQEQPELPVLKNDGQRKEWLRDYQNWGLWYVDDHIGVRYYKYDFSNGARLIAEEYIDTLPNGEEYETSFYHLVGGPEPPRHPKYGYPRWGWHTTYKHHPDSETELVEFLRALQKERK